MPSPAVRYWKTKIAIPTRVLIVGGAVFAAWLAFPSWIGRYKDRVWDEGRSFFLNPPAVRASQRVEVDLPELLIGAAVIALLTGIAFLVARAGQGPLKTDEQLDLEDAERAKTRAVQAERDREARRAKALPTWVVVVGVLLIPVLAGIAMLLDRIFFKKPG